MSDISVVVGYSDTETRDFISDYLDTFEYNVLEITQYGFECLMAIDEYNPDLVICDAYMYDMNACELAKAVEDRGKSNAAFVVVSKANITYSDNVLSCGYISFYSMIPFDYLKFDKEIKAALKHNGKPYTFVNTKKISEEVLNEYNDLYDDCSVVNCIREYMHKFGIPAKLRGYGYIFDSVLLALKNSGILHSITKQLYPMLAKTGGASIASVERAIRIAVKYAWENGDYDMVTDMFGSILNDGDIPTNGQFISVMTEQVKNKLGIL